MSPAENATPKNFDDPKRLPFDLAEGECWGLFQRGDAYQVIPRVLLCGMPLDWQEKFCALLEEMQEVYDTGTCPTAYTVQLRNEHGMFVKDWMTDYRHMPVSALPYRQPVLQETA